MLINADCFEALKGIASNSVEAVVTDPPYGLGACTPAQVSECLQAWSSGKTWKPKGSGFMGKAWDAWVPPPDLWREVLRVLKHGGHAIVFAGSRTQDLMGMSLRLAGFEMRDVVQWIYGSGFPKGHNISKAIDKAYGATREIIGYKQSGLGTGDAFGILQNGTNGQADNNVPVTSPATEQAQQWEGWNTALKPAYEPALLVRKPLSGTVAQNTLDHGCGGLNIDGCRIETDEDIGWSGHPGIMNFFSEFKDERAALAPKPSKGQPSGRWPSNVILDEQASEQLEQQAGASRFFYTAKPSTSERHAGIKAEGKRANVHPTVKPIDLMRYLIRLITPPHGTVLDPFMGSGSTGCAAALEGVDFIGIEREPEYFAIAQQRVAYWGGDVEGFEYPEPEPDEPDQLSLFW